MHRFKLRGKECGIPCAGGLSFAYDARRVHLGDFPWLVNGKFTYTCDFVDYRLHRVRPTAMREQRPSQMARYSPPPPWRGRLVMLPIQQAVRGGPHGGVGVGGARHKRARRLGPQPVGLQHAADAPARPTRWPSACTSARNRRVP